MYLDESTSASGVILHNIAGPRKRLFNVFAQSHQYARHCVISTIYPFDVVRSLHLHTTALDKELGGPRMMNASRAMSRKTCSSLTIRFGHMGS